MARRLRDCLFPNRFLSVVRSTIAIAVFLIAATTALAGSAAELIARAEKVNVARFRYAVEVNYTVTPGTALGQRRAPVKTGGNLMRKQVGRRLKNVSASGVGQGGERAPARQNVPFVLDISSMLEDLSGRVTWELAGAGESNGERCRLLTARDGGWRVDLCVREGDGAILRHDQYLRGERVAISHITYGAPLNGVLLPATTRTYFMGGNAKTVELTYHNYTLEAH